MKLYEVFLYENRIVPGFPVSNGFVEVGSQRVRVTGSHGDRIFHGSVIPSIDEGFVVHATEQTEFSDFEAAVIVRGILTSAEECGPCRLRVRGGQGEALFTMAVDGGVIADGAGGQYNIWYDSKELGMERVKIRRGEIVDGILID